MVKETAPKVSLVERVSNIPLEYRFRIKRIENLVTTSARKDISKGQKLDNWFGNRRNMFSMGK